MRACAFVCAAAIVHAQLAAGRCFPTVGGVRPAVAVSRLAVAVWARGDPGVQAWPLLAGAVSGRCSTGFPAIGSLWRRAALIIASLVRRLHQSA